MAPGIAARRRATAKAQALLDSLEQRLSLLTSTLQEAEVAEKSLDIVKEIKELHGVLRAARDTEQPAAEQRLVVVWGGPENSGASSAGPGRLAGRATAAAAIEKTSPSSPR